VVPLLQSYGSKNRGSGPVCCFVTRDPNILHQAVDNLNVISEPDQLTTARAGRRVRKRRNWCPVNNAWDRNHEFLRGQWQGVNIGFHFIFQSMWDSTASMTWLWAGRSARDLSHLQSIHTSHITYTFSYSIGTTGSIPERRQGMRVTTHLHIL